MDISIFEVIGPIMMGPSSSGTAGMARIGSTAHQFLREEIKSIDVRFCPQYGEEYFSCRSHLALIGGAMGIPEDDTRLRDALTIAKEKGITLTQSLFTPPIPPHPLAVKLTIGLASGKTFELTGSSVGGGSITIDELDGFPIKPASTEAHIFVWADRDITEDSKGIAPEGVVHYSRKENQYLFYISVDPKTDPKLSGRFLSLAGVTRAQFVSPFIPLGYIPHTPLFTTFDQLVALSQSTGKSVAELAIDYEINRTGKTRKEIWDTMAERLNVMRRSMEEGLKGTKSLCGFDTGDAGKRLMEAYQAGKTMGGSVVPKAIARGLAIMEVAQSMGVIVATPTGGSSGVIPGPLFTLQDEHGFTDGRLIEALFVCAAMGVVMYFHHSTFSGSAGGCQAEVGVSSGMTAGGIVYLAGGSAKQIAHGAALAIKNILGLICDPVRGSCEVPCVKRNGIGIANAFSGADMAIAGIESYIPPDEVIDSLVKVQRMLPAEMRCGSCGVPSTPTGARAAEISREVCRDILLPVKE